MSTTGPFVDPPYSSTQPPGLYRKFDVRRVDGRDAPGGDREGAEYIVLDLTYDEHARTAALAYASAIQPDYPNVAADIHDKVKALPPIPKPAPAAPADDRPVWQRLGDLASRHVKLGDHALLAIRDGDQPPLVLAMGESLCAKTQAGAVMARLFAQPGRAPWYVIGVIPGNNVMTQSIRAAARRIMDAARLVDLPVAAVVMMKGTRQILLAESDPAWFSPGPAGNPVALPAVGGGGT